MTDSRPRHLRAPTEDGAALVDPPLAMSPEVAIGNHSIVEGIEGNSPPGSEGQERLAATFTELAHLELGINAYSYSKYLPRKQNPWGCREDVYGQLCNFNILSGHQPELFHCGVWFKNFVLSAIRAKFGARATNILIDNDAVKLPSIRVPAWSGQKWHLETVPFDAYDAADFEIAWEERPIRDRSTFESFGNRVRAIVDGWPKRPGYLGPPLIVRLWPHAVHFANAAVGAQKRLGAALAGARHILERELGLDTVEYPLSYVAATYTFGSILSILLTHLPVAHGAYNDALAAYRLANRIRSKTHPVPALTTDEDWWEAPCWIWTRSDPRRRRLFARQRGDETQLTDRAGLYASIPAGIAENASEAIVSLERHDGIKIRPRALFTTMYLRLYLSDLFIHGIGGAKYDELTDEIIRRFFGIEPPGYLTATATFRLPIDRPQVTIEEVRGCVQRIRDVRFRPESFVGDPLLAREPQIAQQLIALAAEKRDYVRTNALRRGTEEAFRGVDRINREMHELLRPVEGHLRHEHARLVEDARRTRLLGSREFSFVLFPEEYLVPRLLALAEVPA